MTRAEVEKRLRMDGGMQSPSLVRFAHPDCPCFKLDVGFSLRREPGEQGPAVFGPDDRVTTVSKPYLELPVSD